MIICLINVNLNDVNFIKPNDWTFQNGSLKAHLLYVNSLCLIQDWNIKLSESIVNVIEPNSKFTKSVSMSSKLFLISMIKIFYLNYVVWLFAFLFVHVNLLVPVIFVQVNLFLAVMFVPLNMFLLVMFVQANLFV